MSKPFSILLAEDNSGDVFLVRQALAHHNILHELAVVSDGDEALRYLKGLGQPNSRCLPDLILLDLNLPKTDGHELLTTIRTDPGSKKALVIIITSSDSPRDRKRSADLGANSYFKKPFNYDEFLELGAVIKDLLAAPRL